MCRRGPSNRLRLRGSPAAALALVLLLACIGADAADDPETTTLQIDQQRSRADFEVRVLWLIGVHGRFGRVHGSVTLDHFHGSVRADASIDVDAISMRNHSYEDWVKSDEFFDVARYPQIHFVSDAVPLARLRSGGEISGILSLRGVERPVKLELDASDCPEAIASACPVEASGTIRRSEFGMHSRRGTLSDKVELGFSIYLDTALPEQGRSK
jgi:polyisoprenoid-binding protein YceI